jgi:hypothetical protein
MKLWGHTQIISKVRVQDLFVDLLPIYLFAVLGIEPKASFQVSTQTLESHPPDLLFLVLASNSSSLPLPPECGITGCIIMTGSFSL